MRAFVVVLILLGSIAVLARDADPVKDPSLLDSMPESNSALYKYFKLRLSQCQGDGVPLEQPVEVELGGKTYVFTGPTLARKDASQDMAVTLGILGAVKDFGPETQKALDFFVGKFKAAGVDELLLLGDLASSEYELTQVLLYLAKQGWPVMSLIGNTEGRSEFNRAHLAALKATPNLINLDIVRRIDLGGAVLVTLPGYQDRRFVHQSAGCSYQAADVRGLAKWTEQAGAPVVLVSHGPPRGTGKEALDLAVEGGNVGDTNLDDFIRDQRIPFGVFSHILEAGGRAVDDRGKVVPPGKSAGHLLVNVGSANPLPWQLNGGKLSCGMGVVLRVKNQSATWMLIDNACPKR